MGDDPRVKRMSNRGKGMAMAGDKISDIEDDPFNSCHYQEQKNAMQRFWNSRTTSCNESSD